MKKTVILILAVLPIVLLLTIAFAGRILSNYQHIAVERVIFVNDQGEELSASAVLTLGTGETKPTAIKIYPELANDKRVSYTSSNESVCTVDTAGAVTGVGAGSAIITVRTLDGDKTAMLDVLVTADRVTGVTLTPESLEMMIGENRTLQAVVKPFAALNKHVTYKSSDDRVVTVNALGKIVAVGEGTATVTVITEDGGFTDTCTVTVIDTTPPLLFDFTGNADMQQTGSGYITTAPTVDLSAYLVYDEDAFTAEDIHFRVTGNSATLDEHGVLTFTKAGIVTVVAFVGNEETPTYRTELLIMMR